MSHRGKVYVIDDDEAMRDSLEFLLGSADFAVTLFESAQHFLDALAEVEFGCVVSDVRMPGIDGIELLKRLKTSRSTLPVLIMTGHGDVPLAVEAMKLGAFDFFEKPFDDEAIVSAVRLALDRLKQTEKASADRAELEKRLASLSSREREVLDGLIAGHANMVIASDLAISPRTVEIYRANVMTKMQ